MSDYNDNEDTAGAVAAYLNPGQGQPAQAAKAAMTVAAGSNPDLEAELRRVAERTGVPLDAARAYPDEVKQQAALQAHDFDALARQFPSTTRFLADPDNARIAHDDVANLSNTEAAIRALPAPSKPAPSFGAQALDFAAENLKSLVSAPGSTSAGTEFGKGLAGSFNKAAGSVNLVLGAFPTLYDKAASLITGKNTTSASDYWFRNMVDPRLGTQSKYEAPKDAPFVAKAGNTAGNLLGVLAQIVGTGGGGELAPAADTVAGIVGQTAAHGAKSMAFPAIADSVAMGNNVYQQTGDINAAMRAAQAQYLSTTMAGIVPLGVPGGLAARSATGFLSGAIVSESSRATMNMVLPTSMAQPFDLEQTMLSGLAGAGLGMAMGPRAEPGYHDALRRTYADAARADRAEQGMQALAALGEVATSSKTRERDPAAFRQLVQDMTENGQLQDVYVSAKDLGEVLNQSGVTPAQLAAALPDLAAQLHEATMTNGDVRIPVEDYATHIAGGPVDAALLPHLKTDAEGMTFKEAQDHFAGQQDAMHATAEQLGAEQAKIDTKAADSQGVHDDILAQLNRLGRFNPETNKSYAALMRAFFETQGERHGLSAREVYDRSGLSIKGQPIIDGLDKVDRGAYDPKTATLALLKAADLSTFLHESGHFFLEAATTLAARPEATDSMRTDSLALLSHLGVETPEGVAPLDHWAGLSVDEKRAAHEQFAVGFEKYLMEGRAPTIELQSLFSRFRSWLVNIYKSLAKLDVKLSPEVRGIMDRMLASDEAIREAEQTRKYKLLFDSPESAETSRELFGKYEALGTRATDEAIADMTGRSMRDLQWASNAKAKAIRALQKEAAGKRAVIRDQVEQEINQQPVFEAAEFIRTNTGDVEHKEALAAWTELRDAEAAAVKADTKDKDERAARMADWNEANPKPERAPTPAEQWTAAQDTKRVELTQQVKDEYLAKPEAEGAKGLKKGQYLAKNKRAIDNEVERRLIELAKDKPKPAGDGPLPKEFVAEMFGFPDEKTMMDAIKAAGNKKAAIESITDQRMLEQHGELTDAAHIEQAAHEAVHNETRARFMATGLKILSKSPIPARQLVKAAREAAEASIAAKRMRDLRPAQYLAAEARSNAEAVKLAPKDPAGAVQAQRAALLNNQLFRAADTAVRDTQKSLRYLARFNRDSVRAKIDVEYRDQIDALLDRHDLRQSVSGTALDKREALLSFVERMAAAGFEPRVPEGLLNEARRTHYKDMTVEEFNGLVDAVKSIDHLGRLKTELLDGREKREIEALATEAANTMAELKQRGPESNRGLSRIGAAWLGAKSAGRSLQASLLKMEQMMDWLDNRNPNGVLNRVVFRRIADAGVKEADLQAKVKAGIDELMHAHLEDVTKDGGKIYVADNLIDSQTGQPQRFTKKEMLALAGNMGNDSNLSKLAAGEKWDQQHVWNFLHENMSKADWDFVAGLGRTLESLWPEKLAMSRRLGNSNPEKIAPRPFDTPHGRYDGWYWPMIYDPARAQDVAERGARSGDSLFENVYSRANTDTGRTNTRSENYARPLLLSLDVIPRVIKDEIHDIAYREAVMDADRFLSNGKVRDGIVAALSQQHYDQLRPWLQSIANDRKVDMQALKWFDQVAHGARTRATIVGLGYRLSTMLVHGSSAAMESIAEVGPVWMSKGVADFANPMQWAANKDFIFERSGEMRNRMNEVDRDVREHLREIDLRLMDTTTGVVARGADLMKAHAYQGIAMLDMASALPTWMAAYHKGMAPEAQGGKGLSEQDAIYFADKTVRNAHGGTGVKDMAAVQRGPEFMKLFTMFYTFWNHNVNRLMDTARMAGELPATYRSGEMAKFRGDLGNVIMRTLIYTIGVQAMHGIFHPKQDEDGDTHWAAWAAKEFTAAAFAGIPILRDLSAHYLTGKDYSATPAASMVDAVGRSGQDAANAMAGQEVSEKWVKHTVTTAGYVFGLPTGQAASAVQFLWDVEQGKAHPEGVADWWRGVMHGDMNKK
jgi:hypothetical protein